jgi:hypothetical protein
VPSVRLNPRINFFATYDELAGWLGEWVRRFGLHCVLARHPPTVITRTIPWANQAAVARLLRENRKVVLRLESVDTDVPNVNYLAEKNPGMLSIHLPYLSQEGLRYGDLGTGTEDRIALRTWRALGRDFLDRTEGGLWGLFPRPGGTGPTFDAKFRYGPEAAEWQRAGVPLRGAGSDTWYVPQPRSKKAVGSRKRIRDPLLPCLFGDPGALLDRSWLSAAAVALARRVYDEGDFAALPVLADALEEAGCTRADLLGHLRGPGPHLRGCWAVSLVLGVG